MNNKEKKNRSVIEIINEDYMTDKLLDMAEKQLGEK